MTTFPLSLSANWLSDIQTDDLTPTEQEWLFEPHSLTAKLKSKATSFSVKVLSEQAFNLSHEQQQLLGCKTSSALNREVLLLCDNNPMVYAQSWLPNNQTHNSLHNLSLIHI